MSLLVVASTNPVKINAGKQICEKMFPGIWEVTGISAPSGVSDQPLSSKETRLGAENRLHHIQKEAPEADMWIAIEGGIEDTENGMACFAWVLLRKRGSPLTGQAKTGTIFLPEAMRKLLQQGLELGAVDDILFKQANTKQKNGAVGLLTNDAIDRTGYYLHAGILASATFLYPDLYTIPPKD